MNCCVLLFDSMCFKAKQTHEAGKNKNINENAASLCRLVSLDFLSPSALLLGCHRHSVVAYQPLGNPANFSSLTFFESLLLGWGVMSVLQQGGCAFAG